MRRLLLALPILLFSTAVLGQEHRTYQSSDALKWQPEPALPKGAEVAILSGDPSASSGSFALRLKFPAASRVPPHTHSTTEQVTVISGEMSLAMGDKLDEAKGQEFKAGGFFEMPAKMSHSAWTRSGTIIQVQGQSPFDITYVNPADDPRK